jgi:hypothetical protein
MPKLSPRTALLATAIGGLVCFSATFWPAVATDEKSAAQIPIFNPSTISGWIPDRPTGDDFLPPANGGAGPVMSDPKYPYVPNGGGRQSTYRVADLNNPILQDWVKVPMKKANDDVLAGKVPYITRERCWPAGVPGYTVYTRGGQPLFFYQLKDKVLIVNELNTQVRHVYLDVPHSKTLKPSWYGESVGHYEGDTLVVDTIGLNDRTFLDDYLTPHTDKLHVVERYRLTDGGKTLEVAVTVDDPGAFTMPWSAMQYFKRVEPGVSENDGVVANDPTTGRSAAGALAEESCAESTVSHLGEGALPVPQAKTPDF